MTTSLKGSKQSYTYSAGDDRIGVLHGQIGCYSVQTVLINSISHYKRYVNNELGGPSTRERQNLFAKLNNDKTANITQYSL